MAQAVDAYLTTGQLSEVYVKPKRHDIPQLFNLDDYADPRGGRRRSCSPPRARHKRTGRFDEVKMLLDEHAVQEECRALPAV